VALVSAEVAPDRLSSAIAASAIASPRTTNPTTTNIGTEEASRDPSEMPDRRYR
jgi:hypothetical protein